MEIKENRLAYGQDAVNPYIVWGNYPGGRIAIQIVDEDGPLARATVNILDAELSEGCVFIKDYSENAGMVETLIESGIIEGEPVDTAVSGFELIESYRLTDKAMEEAV